MIVVVPVTNLQPETFEALEASGHDWFACDVSETDHEYWKLLSGLWQYGQDFAVVEQDIVIAPDTLSGLDACENLWCAATYPYLNGQTYAGLGCTRFRAKLLLDLPTLMDRVAVHNYGDHGMKHWCTLDAAMQRELWKSDRYVCTHEGVGHLHDWPSHGCVPR